MSKFAHVRSNKVSSANTVSYPLYDIGMDGAALTVTPATRANKAYQAAVTKKMAPYNRRLAGGKVTSEFLEMFRNIQKELYAQHVVKGWDKIVDVSDKPVPFSKEDCKDFLDALPEQTFDQLIQFCELETNFQDHDTGEAAKN